MDLPPLMTLGQKARLAYSTTTRDKHHQSTINTKKVTKLSKYNNHYFADIQAKDYRKSYTDTPVQGIHS